MSEYDVEKEWKEWWENNAPGEKYEETQRVAKMYSRMAFEHFSERIRVLENEAEDLRAFAKEIIDDLKKWTN